MAFKMDWSIKIENMINMLLGKTSSSKSFTTTPSTTPSWQIIARRYMLDTCVMIK